MADTSDIEKPEDSLDQPVSDEAGDLTPEEITELENEFALRDKYGAREGLAAALGAARGVSFGLSDQVAKKVYGEEGLREIKRLNPKSSMATEFAAIGLSSIPFGGTTAVARGAVAAGKLAKTALAVSKAAKVAAAPIRATIKGGKLVEKGVAKTLDKLIKDTGRESIVRELTKKTLARGAGGVLEGTAFGVGELIHENALGDADLTAENLMAFAGTGALFGGIGGGVFGGVEALTPIISKGSGKIKDIAVRQIKNVVDEDDAARGIIGYSASGWDRLGVLRPDVKKNATSYLKNDLKLSHFDSTDKLIKRNAEILKATGEEIGTLLKAADDAGFTSGHMPIKGNVAQNVINTLERLRGQFEDAAGKPLKTSTARSAFRKITSAIREWEGDLGVDEVYKASELNNLKRKFQGIANWARDPEKISVAEEINREISRVFRSELLDAAEKISTVDANLGKSLRDAFLRFGTGSEISGVLNKKLGKGAAKEFFDFRDYLLGAAGAMAFGGEGLLLGGVRKLAQSDFVRRSIILADAQKIKLKNSKQIIKAAKQFAGKTVEPARVTSIKALVDSGLASKPVNGKRKKPENKKQAVVNVIENVTSLSVDQEALFNRLIKSTARLGQAAPNIAAATQVTMTRAIQFLASKVPPGAENLNTTGGLKREYQPSSLDIAKFERYIEAIDNPLSLLDDLNSNTLTREKVEAVRVVYPSLYQEMVTDITNSIAEMEEPLSYQKRAQLAVLMDMEPDPSFMPESIVALQTTFGNQAQSDQAAAVAGAKHQIKGAVKTTQGGLEGLEGAKRATTPTQTVAAKGATT